MGSSKISVLLLVVNSVAYYLTRSVAILTDALESIVNVSAGLLVFIVCISLLPRDANHYGHGRWISFSRDWREPWLVRRGDIIGHKGSSGRWLTRWCYKNWLWNHTGSSDGRYQLYHRFIFAFTGRGMTLRRWYGKRSFADGYGLHGWHHYGFSWTTRTKIWWIDSRWPSLFPAYIL